MLQEISPRRTFILTACLGWAVLLSILAVMPHAVINRMIPIPISFDLAHVIAYGIFSFLICYYLQSYRDSILRKINFKKVLFYSVMLSVVWGGVNELLQFTTYDRTPDIMDVLMDLLGAVIGSFAYRFI